MKKIICIFLVILLCGLSVSCSENPNLSSPTDTTPKTVDTDNIHVVEIEGTSWPDSKLTNRETWNIELSLSSATKEKIVIRMVDHDNIGVYHSPFYCVLEYLDGDSWVNLTNIPDGYAWTDLTRIISIEDRDYTSTAFSVSKNNFRGMEDFKSGHYRFTKILDNKPFSCEFDLNFD